MNDALIEAKAIKEITSHEEMEHAIAVCNALAKLDSPAADKQFERLTTLLAQPLQPA